MSQQGYRQAAVRAVTGTAGTYEGDWHALFDQQGIPAGEFDGRLLAWINQALGAAYVSLPEAMQAFAVSQGAANWGSMGSFAAYNYYVDSVSGSDGNSGLSPTLAFASVAPLIAMSAHALDSKTVAFKRGGSYTPMDLSTITADNCRFTAYGSGALPTLDCTAAIPASWTLHAAGIWKVTLARGSNTKMYGNYFRNGVPMRKVDSVANLSGKGDFVVFAETETGSSFTLYMNAPSDPAADGATYRFSKYGSAVSLTGRNNRVEYLYAIGPCHQDGAFRVGDGSANTGGNTLAYCQVDWGGRHSAYVASGSSPSYAIGNTFNGGANEVETGGVLNGAGTANALVFNTADHSAATCYSIGNTYNGMGRANYIAGTTRNFTGPYGHDGTPNRPMARFVSYGDVFNGMAAGPGGVGATTEITGSTFTACTDGVSPIYSSVTVTMTGVVAGSTCDRLFAATDLTGLTFQYWNNGRMIIPDCGAGNSGFFRCGEGTTTQVFLDIQNSSFHIQGLRTANVNRKFIALLTGSVKFLNNSITPALAPPVDTLFDLGATVTVNASNDNNTFPLGSNFKLGSTTYRGLLAWQTATATEAHSAYQALPTPELSDDFTGADTNLENVPPWVRLNGVAGALQRKSNLLSATSTTQSVYTRGDLSGLEQYVAWTVKAVPSTGGPGPAIRVVDSLNWLQSRVTPTAHQLIIDTAGAVTVPLQSTAVTPAVGQGVIDVVRNYTDPSTGAVDLRAWRIVDGALLYGMQQLSASALTSELTVGAVARSAVSDVADDLKFGTCPLAA